MDAAQAQARPRAVRCRRCLPAHESLETNQRAVLALYDESAVKLLRYARAFGLSDETAEDVVQDVFVALFRHLCLGRPRHSLTGWLFRVTRNLSLKQRQRQRGAPADLLTDLLLERIADPGHTPEERAAFNAAMPAAAVGDACAGAPGPPMCLSALGGAVVSGHRERAGHLAWLGVEVADARLGRLASADREMTMEHDDHLSDDQLAAARRRPSGSARARGRGGARRSVRAVLRAARPVRTARRVLRRGAEASRTRAMTVHARPPAGTTRTRSREARVARWPVPPRLAHWAAVPAVVAVGVGVAGSWPLRPPGGVRTRRSDGMPVEADARPIASLTPGLALDVPARELCTQSPRPVQEIGEAVRARRAPELRHGGRAAGSIRARLPDHARTRGRPRCPEPLAPALPGAGVERRASRTSSKIYCRAWCARGGWICGPRNARSPATG